MGIRAGRGVGSGSPTGEAILTSTIDDQERQIGIERANYLTRADLSMRAADMQRRKARTSLLAGDLQAAGDIFSAGSKLGWLAYNAQPYTPTSVRSNSDPRRIGSLY